MAPASAPTPTSTTTRDKYNRQSLGTLSKRLKSSKVLLVGAGGIGCELLKNLVLSGFGNIDVIDLDTIDLSNLNRQFLFRHEHIKKSKALIAKEVASKFRPGAKIKAHLANIKDPQFSVDWFASFDLVFNALDNLEARRHVNKMCLAAEVPLIESGTTGFNGQVQVIKKGLTECYDCNTKPLPKSFPVCTIRSTPTQPIHCIVWAKSYLLPELFGKGEDEDNFDHSEDADNAEEIENLRKEAQALQAIRSAMDSDDFAQKVFDKVFHADIERLRQMEDMWRTKRPPEPLSYSNVDSQTGDIDQDISVKGQKPWSLEENLVVFKDSLHRLSKRYQQQIDESGPDAPKPVILFDKDDVDTLDFVASAANLRSFIFGIPLQSKFNIQQMAGNIIPAIATTNAMTAALCVLQAYQVMRDDFANAGMLFLERSGARAINSDTLRPPNPKCPVCSTVLVRIGIDPDKATLEDVVEKICREQMGYGEEFAVLAAIGTVYDPDLDDNLPKKLTGFDIVDGASLTVVDEEDFGEEGDTESGPRVNVELLITFKSDLPEGEPVALLQPVPAIPKKPRPAPVVEAQPTATSLNPVSAAPTKTDRVELLSPGPQKRKRSTDISSDIELLDADSESPPSKKREVSVVMEDVDKVVNGGEDKEHAIMLDEEDDGVIILDDE
ncbi:hypothetical protein KEM56_002676 [Ascosphaera pollenicola]|nr:hypothetical protein KEM56_002676 [Ascosphaera pollenicola]